MRLYEAIPYILCAAALASCSDVDGDYGSIVPDDYNSILTVKDSGVRDVTMSVADGQYTCEVPVLKGGVQIEAEADVMIDVMTQQWMDEHYNDVQGTRYRVIPAAMYSVHDYHMTIRPGESGRAARVTFDAPRIYEAMQRPENAGYDMVVPLRVVTAGQRVDTARDLAILHAVVSPVVVSLQDERVKVRLTDDGQMTRTSFAVEKRGAYATRVRFDVMAPGYLTEHYSIPEEIDYRILSPDMYEMEPEAELPAEAEFYNHPLALDGARIEAAVQAEPGRTFVLPLTMTTLTAGAVTDRSDILILCGSHDYTFVDIADKSGWSVAYGTIAMPYGRYSYMMDGVEDGDGWMSYINDGFPNSQGLGRPYAVVDLGNRAMVGELGVKLGHNNGYHDVIPGAVEFYVTDAPMLDPELTPVEWGLLNSQGNWGDDTSVTPEYIALHDRLRVFDSGVSWIKVGAVTGLRNEPSACGTYWVTVPPAVLGRVVHSRYIKVVLIPNSPSSETGNRVKVHELYVRKVSAIDGEPIY